MRLSWSSALIAEQFGRAVAPAPVIEAQVAARLLAGCGGSGIELLGQALSGDKLVSFAPRAGSGAVLGLVPAGAVADAVVALVDQRLVVLALVGQPRPVQNLGSLPLADITIDGDVAVLAEGPEARRLFSDALDLWLTLTAMALAGAAKKAVEIGVEYAKQRHAFGTAIGTFQAVSHPLADSATAADGARLLASRRRVRLSTSLIAGRRTRGDGVRVRVRDRPAMQPIGACTSTAATGSGWKATSSCTTAGSAAGPWCTASRQPHSTGWRMRAMEPSGAEPAP